MNPISGSTILWSILGEHESFNVLRRQYKGFLSGSYGPKIGKICMKYDIWYFSVIFTSKRQKLIHFLVVLFYGVFWENMSLLTYLNLLLWWYEGLVSGLEGPKIAQNYQIYYFWDHSTHFISMKVSNEYIFWQY